MIARLNRAACTVAIVAIFCAGLGFACLFVSPADGCTSLPKDAPAKRGDRLTVGGE